MKYKLKIILLFILCLQDYKPLSAQPGRMFLGDDYCLFSLKNENITAMHNPIFYNKNFFLFHRDFYTHYSKRDFLNSFVFVKENDTMVVYTYLHCCSNYYYIKNLEFKKGSYFLIIKNHEKLEEVNGFDIETPECLQNILLKVWLDASVLSDAYFKDLKFTIIDLMDTLNTHLEPIKEEDFEDMDFSFYFNNVEKFWDEYAIYIDTMISVSSDTVSIENENGYYYLFTFKKTEKEIISIFDRPYTGKDEILFYNKNFFLIEKNDLFYSRFKKFFFFINGNDTMAVYTYLSPNSNYYIKDLEFKKGSYFLKINDYRELRWITGSDSKTPKKLHNILFKDYRNAHWNEVKEIYFRDLNFTSIDLTDTSNIQLVPMSKKEFWDDEFKIKIK
jgi:hypothetical protein